LGAGGVCWRLGGVGGGGVGLLGGGGRLLGVWGVVWGGGCGGVCVGGGIVPLLSVSFWCKGKVVLDVEGFPASLERPPVCRRGVIRENIQHYD